MNPEQAENLARTRSNGLEAPRALHSNPDSRSSLEQLQEREAFNFRGRLAQAAIKHENEHGRWPSQRWFNTHEADFARRTREEYRELRAGYIDPPCKNWEKRLTNIEPSMLAIMKKLWALNLNKWGVQHPYLASPSAPCECQACSSGPKKRHREPEQWPELELPSEFEF